MCSGGFIGGGEGGGGDCPLSLFQFVVISYSRVSEVLPQLQIYYSRTVNVSAQFALTNQPTYS